VAAASAGSDAKASVDDHGGLSATSHDLVVTTTA
jgi:hypothetical protein